MPTHAEKKVLPYTPGQMFDLVADIERYPWPDATLDYRHSQLAAQVDAWHAQDYFVSAMAGHIYETAWQLVGLERMLEDMLVRPAIAETMVIPRWDIVWNEYMRYEPEKISDVIRDPEPERDVPPPPSPELYNIADDPLEEHDLANEHPDRASKMVGELEEWFERVEAERATIDDVW